VVKMRLPPSAPPYAEQNMQREGPSALAMN
jgi:hypothetical protein